MTISSRYIVRLTSAFLLVGFVALMAIVGMTFWLGEQANSYFQDAILARDTRGAGVELRGAIQTAESSQRGFVVTGNEIYLAPYQTAKAQVHKQLAALFGLLTPYPGSDAALARLSTILDGKLEEMDRTIALKRDRRDEEVLAIF